MAEQAEETKRRRGRPRLGPQTMTQDSYSASPDMLKLLKLLAKRLRVPKSKLVREGIYLTFDKYKHLVIKIEEKLESSKHP